MRVFISRTLTENSPLWQIKERWPSAEIRAQSLIDIQALAFSPPTDCDILFFYSRNGVRCFFENLPLDYKLPALAAIGAGTAEEIAKYTQNIDFIGNGEPQQTAKDFVQVATGKKVGFICGKNSLNSVRKAIESAENQPLAEKNQIIALDFEVYSNQGLKADFAADNNILILTSPMNVTAYFESFSSKNITEIIDFVVVIGNSTAKSLHRYYQGETYIATQASEAGLFEAFLLGIAESQQAEIIPKK
jgi:uroporphyrinogen-III synthase